MPRRSPTNRSIGPYISLRIAGSNELPKNLKLDFVAIKVFIGGQGRAHLQADPIAKHPIEV
jgi:hypothetical protein